MDRFRPTIIAFTVLTTLVSDGSRASQDDPASSLCLSPPGTYVVLFDFDSATINAAGQAVINQILSDIEARGATGASATGYADRSGSEQYNMVLSLRRADSVREALIAGGVPAEAIISVARGESTNAVPTPDGVRQQANRRVEIILQ